LPQWRTEEILLAHLERLGSSVEQGTTVTSVEQVDDHLLLTLERADSGRETVGARYLIGAGGARSITRSSMRERLEGETYAGRYVVADARLASPVAPGEGTVVVSPKGFVLFGPLPGVLKPVVARYQGKVSRIYFRADAAFAMPEGWSLTTLKDKLIKIGAKVVSHGRYVIFQMAEVAIARQMFQEILRLIAELRPQPPPALA
jgi:2-polyprenyl-6-methoxyphenol hydroxylase-like FAD-dependent oxidoreductase